MRSRKDSIIKCTETGYYTGDICCMAVRFIVGRQPKMPELREGDWRLDMNILLAENTGNTAN